MLLRVKKTIEGEDDLKQVVEEGEEEKEFDSISRIDQWTTTMLLRVKKTIEGEDDLKQEGEEEVKWRRREYGWTTTMLLRV